MAKNEKTAEEAPKKSAAKPVTVLLTGFDAFAGEKHNPSQVLVESFPDILKGKARGPSRSAKEIHIRKQVLPTAGAKGWKILKKAMDEAVKQAEGPVLIVMLGLAANREQLSLERFAMNFRDYRLPDNNKELRQEETIEPKAPQLLRSHLNLPQLQEVLLKAGYPSEVSNHAGTFICNELYFRALNYKRDVHAIESVLFVHLPPEKTFARTAKRARHKSTPKGVAEALKGLAKAGREKQIEFMSDAIVETIINIAQENIEYPGLRKAKIAGAKSGR
ncbi:MAG: pyroglutamyl-peptidase I [Cyanobacteria bacterium REEB67]|nr:pyroglutamyl-peptidase I [Cyanobacteria bacterium REEB67]